jgi:GTP-binding protein EngB required for normal cell division
MRAYDSYQTALENCKRIAHQEFQCVEHYFAQCDALMNMLQQQFAQVAAQATRTLNGDKMLEDGLLKLQHDLQGGYTQFKLERGLHLAAKKSTLSHFNVMLFGRTMAGKSTIREAITGGDGASIGKGAQRTTSDVREYEWNNLRIIDTPGFGAFGGKEDTQIAHEILERSDVVLFMLSSDSIQEETFKELEYVHKLNKPLIFVLNMKKDLQNEGNRRRALKNPEKYIYKPEDITADLERLQELASRAGMHSGNLRIIPIHAQAAFFCTQVQGDESIQLRKLSHLDELLTVLCQEVQVNGPVRRVQTFLDSALNHIKQQTTLLLQQKDHLDKLRPEYQSALARIMTWRKKLERDAPRLLASEVNSAYKPLIDSVGDFVDEHIEDGNVAREWQRHCDSYKVQQEIETSAQALAEQVVEELSEFTREMNESMAISINLEQAESVHSFDEWDYKRIGGWASSIAGVVGAIAVFNGWNPVGWAAAAVSVGFALFGWLSDSKNKKLREAKNKAREDLLASLQKSKDKTRHGLEDWFNKKLVQGTIRITEGNLHDLSSAIQSFAQAIEAAQQQLDALEQDVNKRLLHRVATIISGNHRALPEIHKVARIPGYASYFLVSDYFRDNALLKQMHAVLNESILVVYNTPLEKKLQHIFKGLVQKIEVRNEHEAVLYAHQENMPKIHGKQRRRIKMAAAISACKIDTVNLGPFHA